MFFAKQKRLFETGMPGQAIGEKVKID